VNDLGIVNRTYEFGADHPAVQGHFDARAIVPGVALLSATLNAVYEAWPDLSTLHYKIVNTKFLKAVEPPAEVEFSVARLDDKPTGNGGTIIVNFECRLGATSKDLSTVAAKGVLHFER
jgi:3-hydroxymyristoyl/3-hydroxydecanoyl-(acyl carrier protein) dehydratase